MVTTNSPIDFSLTVKFAKKLKEIKTKLARISVPNLAKDLQIGEMTLKDIID